MPVSRITETWIMTQTWEHLLFAHWPVPVNLVRPLVPGRLEIDTWQGQGWISAVAFSVSDVRLRLLPGIPLTSGFPQLNLRTYVTVNGQPGVFFLSIDLSHPLAAPAARLLYRLPCRRAKMAMSVNSSPLRIRFQSRRAGDGLTTFAAEYGPSSPSFRPKAGSLDHWLTERYRLASSRPGSGSVFVADISHLPWLLHAARANVERVDSLPVPLPHPPAVLHYARKARAFITAAGPLTDPNP